MKKDIHLSVSQQDKVSKKSFLNNINLNKEIIYNGNYIDIIVSSKDINIVHNEEISKDITNLIIDIIKDKFLKEYIVKEYKDTYKDDYQYIYKHALNLFNEREIIIKKSIYSKVYNYILNNDYIDIEGFVNFRMKEFNKYLFDVADLALEDYLIKKDQDEFISVLKYFIDIQEEKLNLLKVHIKKDNTFILYDELGNKIDSIDDEELINMVIKENLNYEDFLISTLLTLCPKKIEIIDHLNNNCSMEIIDTIKSIFGERVICTYKN